MTRFAQTCLLCSFVLLAISNSGCAKGEDGGGSSGGGGSGPVILLQEPFSTSFPNSNWSVTTGTFTQDTANGNPAGSCWPNPSGTADCTVLFPIGSGLVFEADVACLTQNAGMIGAPRGGFDIVIRRSDNGAIVSHFYFDDMDVGFLRYYFATISNPTTFPLFTYTPSWYKMKETISASGLVQFYFNSVLLGGFQLSTPLPPGYYVRLIGGELPALNTMRLDNLTVSHP